MKRLLSSILILIAFGCNEYAIPDNIPVMEDLTAEVQATSVRINYTIGNYRAVKTAGIIYGTDPALRSGLREVSAEFNRTASQVFSITGLEYGVEYSYRAFAEDYAGTREMSGIAVFRMPDPISVSAETIELPSALSSAVFEIGSTAAWTVSSNQPWCSVSPSSGNGSKTITVSATANTSFSPRSATVTVASGKQAKQIAIRQAAQSMNLEISATTINLQSTASTATFNITSNADWTVSANQSWCTASPSSGNGNRTVTVSAAANTAPESRTATLTISAGSLTRTVTVAQSGASLEISTDVVTFQSAASTATFNITSNSEWSLSSSQTWCTVSSSSGSGNRTITVTATANTTFSNRTATITISSGSLTKTITVTQAGQSETLEISASTMTFQAAAGSNTVNIVSNTSWTVSSSQSWCTVSPASGNGNRTVTVGVSGNTAKAQRTATVSVKTGNLTKTIAVTQSGLSAPTVTTLSATNITQSTATLNKSVTAGTESITAQGFEYRIENATTWIRSISGSLTGLAAGTTYEFRAYAVTATATTYGAVLTFKTLAIIPPTVTTLSAANITQTTAVLNKSVAAGTETVTAQGFEYRKQGAASSWITSTTGNLTNLAENTAYEFRAYAVTASGTTYGATLIFNTLAISPPGIKTQPATAITSSSATLNKSIVAGSEVIIEQGFEYRALNGPKWYVSSSGNLTGLIAGTTYEFRAYAVTASGTTYGTILTFNTLSISAPTVTTLAASNITQTTATLNKSVSAGTEAISSQGFEYRKQGAASWNTSSSGTLANLTENTTYEYRAYAVTASGTFYGDVMTFTTKGVANDLCADATSLIFGTFVSGTLVGSTPSAIYSNYGWLGDVFYQFTPAYTGDYTVTLTKLLLSDDIDVIVYRGCNSTTEVASISANGITETVTFNCTAGTDYRLRVVITGITNGGFKIKVDSPPTVTTQSATDITLTTAILHKSVTAGSEAISSQGFEYRKQGSSNWSASVSGNLANLTENTTYEYRAYAVTASGTTYGTTLTFKTLTDPGTTGTTFGNNVVTSLNYGGGNGTQGSPFLINNVGQLKKLVEDLDTREKYYKLMNDIYVTTNDWTPIGINAVFEGYFDGNGHKITGALTSSRHVKFGFFLEILKGTVSNLAIDATVKNTGTFSANNTYTGSIAAYATDGATITACSFTGSLTGGNITAGYTGGSYTGGIVGEMISCYVNNCTVNAQVISGRSTESRTGGIFAGGQDHAISNCTVSGSIIGSPESSLSTCGGILGGAGCYNGCEHSIVNCTNNASVSGHDAGGIAGVLHDHAGIHSCLNTGNVSCYEGGLAGGIVGNQTFENYVNSCNTNRGLVNGQQPDEHNLLGGGTLGGGISYSRQCPENHTKR